MGQIIENASEKSQREIHASLARFYMQDLAEIIHDDAVAKSWWVDRDELSATSISGKVQVDIGCLALAITELSEAIESIRAGYAPDDKIPKFSGLEAEIADCIIRLLDFSAARKLRVPDAILAKLEFNRGREQRHGGKLA